MAHEAYVREVAGSHTAVVMIHGIAGTPAHFRFLLPLVPAEWSVYNLRLVGHGGSVEDFAAASMQQWKDQVAGVMERVLSRHRQVILTAHSMGTLLAIREALRRPKGVTEMFLLAVPLRPFVRPRTAVDALRVALGRVRPGDRASAMEADCGVDLDRRLWKYIPWAPRFLELLVECRRTRKAVGQLAVPCQVFQSRQDELVSMGACACMAANPHIQVTVLGRSGHFAYSEADAGLLKKRFQEMVQRVSRTV